MTAQPPTNNNDELDRMMPRIIFEFETQEQADAWMGAFADGGGEQAIYECFSQNGEKYPLPKIIEEK